MSVECSSFKSLLLSFLFATTSVAYAQNVSEPQARDIASSFMAQKTQNDSNGRHKALSQQPIAKVPVYTLKDSQGVPTLYVYNFGNNSGYAIVAGEMGGRSDILAYSTTGRFETENMHPALVEILQGYSREISSLRAHEAAAHASAPRKVKSSVAPLLGEREWGQGAPYSNMTPMWGRYNCPTGCVATSTAQVMAMHKWPVKGIGTHSYNWNDTELSADFSNHVYAWDLMKDKYEEGSYTEAEGNAVAQLMVDVGYAFNMRYGENESGTYFRGPEFVEHFDYDPAIRMATREYYSDEEWADLLRSEFDAGRPVIFSGFEGSYSHSFACDGYDSDGKFHYNFGWDGMGNGFFLNNDMQYAGSQEIVYGIQPNKGGTRQMWCYSEEDFKWTEGDNITCKVRGTSYFDVDMHMGVAVTNTQTSAVTYYEMQSTKGCKNDIMYECTFDKSLPDGSYTLQPAWKLNDGEWNISKGPYYKQTVIDLTVSGGQKTYANNNMYEKIDEGTTLINKVFYKLDESSHTASVTYRNKNFNSYSGSVVVPDEVTYNGQIYVVNEIGESAFRDSKMLTSVKIGKNVETISYAAFSICSSLADVVFAEGSQVKQIDGWGFHACDSLKTITLPEGIHTLGACAFASSGLTSIDIPYATQGDKYDALPGRISDWTFQMCTNLKDIYLHWDEPLDLMGYNMFTGIETDTVNLHVPTGLKPLYQSLEPWKYFNIIDDQPHHASTVNPVPDEGKVQIGGIWYVIEEGSGRAKVTYKNSDYNSYTGVVEIPDSVTYNGERYVVYKIDDYAFFRCKDLEKVILPSSIELINSYTFAESPKLKEVDMTKVTRLGYIYVGAFAGDTSLEKVFLPRSLSLLYNMLFSDCTSLKEIDIPEKIYSPREDATPVYNQNLASLLFQGCTGLEHITVHWDDPLPPNPYSFFEVDDVSKIRLTVPYGTADKYRQCDVWKDMMIEESSHRYKIRTADSEDGMVVCTPFEADPGDEVNVAAFPKYSYYAVTSIEVVRTDTGEKLELTDGKFIMPESDVIVSAKYRNLYNLYSVAIVSVSGCKDFYQSVNVASEGQLVTIYYVPSEGYSFDRITVTRMDNNEPVPVNGNEFIMPYSDVRVTLVCSESNAIRSVTIPQSAVKALRSGKVIITAGGKEYDASGRQR